MRRHDPDRFLVSLMMPPAARPALWALFAFNYEIAKTREVVTETTIGLIRLQWWRDALAKIYEDDIILENEILPDLYRAIRDYDLPRERFEALTYAREFDLENVAPASLEGLENYVDFTNTPLLQLALRILGQEEEGSSISALAKAYGLTGLLRAVPFHAAQGRHYMPADLMAAGEEAAAAKTVVERAFVLLDGARPQGRFLKNTKALARLHLGQIRGLKYDVRSPRLAQGPAFFHLRFILKSML